MTPIASARSWPVPAGAPAQRGPTMAQAGRLSASPINFPHDILVARFLRSLHVQIKSARLYQSNHPRLTESFETAERDLRSAFTHFSSFGIRIERGSLLLDTAESAEARPLADTRGELRALSEELARTGIALLAFFPETNLKELALLAQAVEDTCRTQERGPAGRQPPSRDWATWLSEHDVTGIRVNEAWARRDNTVLASLLSAILEREAPKPSRVPQAAGVPRAGDAARAPDAVRKALAFLSEAAPPLEQAQEESPHEAAHAVQAELAYVDPMALNLLAQRMLANPPQEGHTPKSYLARIYDGLAVDFVRDQYMAGLVRAAEVRATFAQLCERGTGTAEDEGFLEARIQSFWDGLPGGEIARILTSEEAWSVPVAVLRRTLEPLIVAAKGKPAQASAREARRVLAQLARCLDSEEEKARRSVAMALVELSDLVGQVWPHAQLTELAPQVVGALVREPSPGIANLLAGVTENLARLALTRGAFGDIEHILEKLDQARRDADRNAIAALASRIVAQERWLVLVDEALTNRPLDPALPRLLRRDPERLVDRLALLLTAPEGAHSFPAMVRLVRGAGEPVLGTLVAHLSEPRRQRAAAAIQLLSAVEPQRLLDVLPRVLAAWDWNLQDLAVTELGRVSDPSVRARLAKVWLAMLSEVNMLVVPSMIDQIALAGEASAAPRLLEIAAGEVEPLRDLFLRIKAVEALGRLRAEGATELLRTIIRQRAGLTYAEPAGLRSAAEESLALIENRPGSARVRAAQEKAAKSSNSFARPRRYLRVVLKAPLHARINAPHSAKGLVRSIAMRGALLQTSAPLSVGDSIQVEIQAGLQRIGLTAVVRNAAVQGYGIEFVHMKLMDREKLRRRVGKLLR